MPRPGRVCKICRDAVLSAKVDALLQTGESVRAVASLAGVDRFAVARHRKHTFPPTITEPENLSELELSDKRLATLSDQLEAQYAAALAVSDPKLAVEILKTRSRIEAERHSRIVEKVETEADDANSEKAMWPTVQQYDNVKNKVQEAYAKWLASGMVLCPFCENSKPVSPKLLATNIRKYQESHDANSADAN